jgi:pimeloyl-ACP methyl ester carboxylesterase
VAPGSRLFVPGWGAPASLYRRGLPAGWEVLELPSFRRTGGDFGRYRDWLRAEIAAGPSPLTLAGHSMGGALAVLAALDEPQSVERLILVSPAGLPLAKPLRGSALTGLGQILRGCYPLGALRRMVVNTVSAPRAALRLARVIHDLDLTAELEQARAHGISCTVVACSSDALTTCAHCRRLAGLLGADYRELEAPGGHIWVITQPERLERELLQTATRSGALGGRLR